MALRHLRRLLFRKTRPGPAEYIFGIAPQQVGGDIDRLLHLGRNGELLAAAIFSAGSTKCKKPALRAEFDDPRDFLFLKSRRLNRMLGEQALVIRRQRLQDHRRSSSEF